MNALATILILSLFAASCQHGAKHLPHGPVVFGRSNYHGWQRADTLANGTVEAVVVPEIGRVMQFGFLDPSGKVEEEPFWNNRTLDGMSPDPNSRDWLNFGGDKTWPAPQEDWLRIEGHAWPPPTAFDSMSIQSVRIPNTASTTQTKRDVNSIEMTSAPDPQYGIRVTRRITLDSSRPMMTITTTYEKLHGKPVRVAVWTLTQLGDPERIFFVMPHKTTIRGGFVKLMGATPKSLKRVGNLLSLARDRSTPSKVGTEAERLIWVGKETVLELEIKHSNYRTLAGKPSPAVSSQEFPDMGSRSEVYTSPDPLQYVELETLGPLRNMRVGDRASLTNTYMLMYRKQATPDAEARVWQSYR